MDPMKWISEHLQFILAGAGAIAYWLTQRRAGENERAEAEKEAAERQAQPASLADAEDESRAGDIREEIRRKIAARRGEPSAAERPEPPMETRPFHLPPLMRPLTQPVDTFGGPARPSERRQEPVRRFEPPVMVPSETLAASLERQEQLAMKLRELTEQRAIAARKAAAVAVNNAAVAQRDLAVQELRHDLRDPRSLRRAMILREVLGTPAGLR